VCGEIDLTEVERFERLLLDAVREAEAVVVDVAELRFIDSTAIGALVAGHNAAKARGCRLTLANPAAQVDRVLRMTGVLDELTA
jgi:anti-sigma B factor antagonist